MMLVEESKAGEENEIKQTICMENATKVNEFLGGSESEVWDDDEFQVGEEFNNTSANDCIICKCIRRKAFAIVRHNKLLSEDKVDIEDAVNLVLILFQTGNLDLCSDPEDFEDNFFFSVDKVTKKVSQLVLQKHPHNDGPLQFPVEMISSLHELEDLKLSNVNVTSSHVNKPPSSTMQGSETTSISNRKERSLWKLKNLDVSYLKMDGDRANLETQFFHLLPKLESITFRMFTGRTEKLYFRNVLSDIGSRFCACHETLRSVNLSYSMLTQEELKILLVNVVPKLSNLNDINVSANKVESIQKVAECIDSSRDIANNSLQTLDLSWNAVMFKIKNSPKERAALLTILRAFKGVYNLGNDFNTMEYPSDIRYQLQINHAGRRLIEDCSLSHKMISMSLMPSVLERAFQKSRDIHPSYWRSERPKDPTGIYYLLHSESILHGLLRCREVRNDVIKPYKRNDNGGETRKSKRRKVIT